MPIVGPVNKGLIINIRGTSGSGKTTVVRSVMDSLGTMVPSYVENRRNPLYYTNKPHRVAVLGSYATDCGGCDTINGYDILTPLAIRLAKEQYVTILEGLLIGHDVKQMLKMQSAGIEVRVVYLTTSIEECLERVKQRRLKKGNTKPLNPKNTISGYNSCEASVKRLENQTTIKVYRCQSLEAPNLILQWVKNRTTKNGQSNGSTVSMKTKFPVSKS